MKKVIYYTSDVSILDHSNFVVYENNGKEAISISRSDDDDKIWVYSVELFKKPSDSWIDENDLNGLNETCDTKYKFNEELSDIDSYIFSQHLCWYYGAENFDSMPLEFTQDEFSEWCEEVGLI